MFGNKKKEAVRFDREWYLVSVYGGGADPDKLYDECAKYEAHGYNIEPESLNISRGWAQIIVRR